MKKILLILVLLLYTFFNNSFAQTKEYNTNKGLALDGYDAVAYHTNNKAIKGKKEFSVVAENIIYYFSSEVNKQLFRANYKKYLPEYGGWCAYAMGATGEKIEVDPETFKILNGKLYLFYHSWVNNTLNKWNKDENNLKTKADINWQKFIKATL